MNTQAGTLSRLRTIGETVAPVEENIPCVYVESNTCMHERSRTDGLDNELEVSDLSLLVIEPAVEPLNVPITEEELFLEQAEDKFCKSLVSRLNRGDKVPFSCNLEGVLCRFADGNDRLVLSGSLQQRVLQLSHRSEMAGHLGGPRLYYFLRKSFYWPTMAMECYAVARNCITCCRNRVLLRRNQKLIKLFPATSPLENVAIDVLGQLLKTHRGNHFLLVTTDRYSKLVRTAPFKNITAATFARALVTHWVMTYGPPV